MDLSLIMSGISLIVSVALAAIEVQSWWTSRARVEVAMTVGSVAYGTPEGAKRAWRPRVTVSTRGKAVGVLDIVFPWLGPGEVPNGFGWGSNVETAPMETLTTWMDFPCTIHAEGARVFVFDLLNTAAGQRLRADVTLIGGKVLRSQEFRIPDAFDPVSALPSGDGAA